MQMRFPPEGRYAKEVIVFTPGTPGLQRVLCADADVDLMTPRTGDGHEVRSNEAWLVAGTAECATGPVTLAACNDGRFQADGQFTLAAGRPLGQVTCSKDGVRQVTSEVR